ncbi:MAG TPA: hypothetical protein VIJ29_00460 [Candidatus Paceibacterota bacterium]
MENSIFLKLIKNLSNDAKKGHWKFFYDKSSDCLYWSKSAISKNVNLKKLSREVSIYMKPNGSPEGLLVQFFQNNFLTQNETLADTGMKKALNKSQEDKPISFGIKTKELEALFVESIKNDILTDAFRANYSLKDLEKIVKV